MWSVFAGIKVDQAAVAAVEKQARAANRILCVEREESYQGFFIPPPKVPARRPRLPTPSGIPSGIKLKDFVDYYTTNGEGIASLKTFATNISRWFTLEWFTLAVVSGYQKPTAPLLPLPLLQYFQDITQDNYDEGNIDNQLKVAETYSTDVYARSAQFFLYNLGAAFIGINIYDAIYEGIEREVGGDEKYMLRKQSAILSVADFFETARSCYNGYNGVGPEIQKNEFVLTTM